ncbi:MAG TPA: hypothetical protein VFJ85_04610 [Acidimicrobiales bacterium]|nr:hypothetical protein [Acidimicrobiales bacterium]
MTESTEQELESVEARLRAAIAGRTATVHPADEDAALTRIERGLDVVRRRKRRTVLAGLAAVAAAALVAVAVPVLRSDDGGQQVRVTASTEVTTTTTTTEAVGPATLAEVVWPPPGHPRFADPAEAVRSFAEGYVGLAHAALGPFRSTGPSAGEVDVLPTAEDGTVRPGVRSTVSVRNLEGSWYVTGARAADIVVDRPAALDQVGSLVVVDGRGSGYEGTIVATVRDAGMGAGGELAKQVVTAGCCEELLPFHVELPVGSPAHASGSLLLNNDSGLEAVSSFTVVPIRFGGTGAPSDETTVQVFFTQPGGQPAAVPRTVRKSAGVLRSALTQLLFGPTSEERDKGLSSGLENAAAGSAPVSVVITDGRAVVDFGADLPRLSPGTSAADASARFLRQLHATVFQFPAVREAEYRAGGSCAAFWSWLQRACTTVTPSNPGI